MLGEPSRRGRPGRPARTRATTSSASSPSTVSRNATRSTGRRLRRPELLELVAHQHHRGVGGSLAGQRRQRVDGSGTGHDARAAATARCRAPPPPRSAGTSPARTTDDFPAPLDPDTTISRWSTRAVTRVPTSRSRPRKAAGVVDLVAGQPLVGAARPTDGVGRRRAPRDRAARGKVERRVLGQDRLLQLTQPDARVDPELLGQHRPRPSAARPAPRPGARSGRAPARAAPTSFSCSGCSATSRSQLGDRLGVPTEGELGLPVGLGGVVVDALEPLPLVLEIRGRRASRRTACPRHSASASPQQVAAPPRRRRAPAAPVPGPPGRRRPWRPVGRARARARSPRAAVRRTGPGDPAGGPAPERCAAGPRAPAATCVPCGAGRRPRAARPAGRRSRRRNAAASTASSSRSLAPGTSSSPLVVPADLQRAEHGAPHLFRVGRCGPVEYRRGRPSWMTSRHELTKCRAELGPPGRACTSLTPTGGGKTQL